MKFRTLDTQSYIFTEIHTIQMNCASLHDYINLFSLKTLNWESCLRKTSSGSCAKQIFVYLFRNRHRGKEGVIHWGNPLSNKPVGFVFMCQNWWKSKAEKSREDINFHICFNKDCVNIFIYTDECMKHKCSLRKNTSSNSPFKMYRQINMLMTCQRQAELSRDVQSTLFIFVLRFCAVSVGLGTGTVRIGTC